MSTMGNISNINLPDGNNYDIRATAIPFGAVDSTSTSTAFTANVQGITALTDGTIVMLKNDVITSSASGFTLNINNLGAKPVYSSLEAATAETDTFNKDYTMIFVYDSKRIQNDGAWILYRKYSSGSGSGTFTVHLTYSGGSEGTWTADKTWAEIDAAYDPENCCICAEYTENSVVNTLPLTSTDSEGSFIFGKLKTENYGGYDQFIININDEIIYEYYQFQSSTTTIRRWSGGESSES